MGKYFGTDGFRGEANVDLKVTHAYKVGRYLGYYFGKDHIHYENESYTRKKNFSGDLQLDYQDQRIFCTIRSFHIGWLLIPQSVSQYFVDREIEKVNQSDFAAIVREFMVSFEPQSDGSIVVHFRPKKIGLLIAFLL